MTREATGRIDVVTPCTFLQLLTCLGKLGLTEEELPEVLREVLHSGHVRLVGAMVPWLSGTAAVRRHLN